MRLVKNLTKLLMVEGPLTDEENSSNFRMLYNIVDILDNNNNEVEARLNALEAKNLKYFVRAMHNADQTSTSGSILTLAFNTTIYPQMGNMHDDSTNNTNFYIRRNGVYDIKATAESTLSSASVRQLGILLNRDGSSFYLALDIINVTGQLIQSASASAYLYEDDYIQIVYLQSSGGDIDVKSQNEYSPVVSITERMEDLDTSAYGLMTPEENFR